MAQLGHFRELQKGNLYEHLEKNLKSNWKQFKIAAQVYEYQQRKTTMPEGDSSSRPLVYLQDAKLMKPKWTQIPNAENTLP